MKSVKKFLLCLCVSLIAVASIAFVGCTDKDNEEEQEFIGHIVGTWKNAHNTELRFKSDGTVLLSAGYTATLTFRCTSHGGNDPVRGDYDIITIVGNQHYPGTMRFAYFYSYPNGIIQLCRINDGVIDEFDNPSNYTKFS